MPLRRISRTPIINGGKNYGTSEAALVIKQAIDNNEIRFSTRLLRAGERLDIVAGFEYNGDSSLYWVIAAASGIGWCLQVPPGTVINIPNLDDVVKLIG